MLTWFFLHCNLTWGTYNHYRLSVYQLSISKGRFSYFLFHFKSIAFKLQSASSSYNTPVWNATCALCPNVFQESVLQPKKKKRLHLVYTERPDTTKNICTGSLTIDQKNWTYYFKSDVVFCTKQPCFKKYFSMWQDLLNSPNCLKVSLSPAGTVSVFEWKTFHRKQKG